MKKIALVLLTFLICGCGSMYTYHWTIENRYDLKPIKQNILQDDSKSSEIALLYYILLNTQELRVHQMNGAINNTVHCKGEGNRYEIVIAWDLDENGDIIDGTGSTVWNEPNQGYLNYHDPETEPLCHFTYDMLPWMEIGGYENDPSSTEQRVSAYILDFSRGLEAAYELPDFTELPESLTLNQKGQPQALSFFFAAMDAGGVTMKSIVHKGASDEDVIRFLKGLERGMIRLIKENNK